VYTEIGLGLPVSLHQPSAYLSSYLSFVHPDYAQPGPPLEVSIRAPMKLSIVVDTPDKTPRQKHPLQRRVLTLATV